MTDWRCSRPDMLSFNGETGHQESFVYPPEPRERITISGNTPVEDARFIVNAINALSDSLRLILPMAEFYVRTNPVQNSGEWAAIAQAKAALEGAQP